VLAGERETFACFDIRKRLAFARQLDLHGSLSLRRSVLIATSATMSPLIMASLLQSSRDQFCNLHMGLQGGIYDGWDNRFSIEPHLTTSGSWLYLHGAFGQKSDVRSAGTQHRCQPEC
jgi:hypothetical protein